VAWALAFSSFYQLGFLADAGFLIADNLYLQDLSYFSDTLTHDYFWSSSGNNIPYWRPFTKLSWLLEAQLFGDWAPGYHLVQCLWLLVCVVGLLVLARQLGLSPLFAAIGATLFVLHPSVVEPGCLVMARSDVTCAAGTIWAVSTWLKWREEASTTRMLLHFAALIVAFTSKESAVVLLPLFILWALMDDSRPPLFSSRFIAKLAPTIGVAGLYLLCRNLVLSGGSGAGIELNPARIFIAGGRYLQGLMPLQLNSSVHNISMLEATATETWLSAGLFWFLVASVAFILWRKKEHSALALLLWAGGALAPVLLVAELNVPGVANKYPLADRWMLQSIASTSLLFAWTLSYFAQKHSRMGMAMFILFLGWTGLALWNAAESHGYYVNDDTLMALEEQHFEQTPERFRTDEDLCRHGQRRVGRLMKKGKSNEAIAAIGALPETCKNEPLQAFNLLSALVQNRDYAQASALAPRVLANPPADRRFHGPMFLLCGITALKTGDLSRAEEWFLRAQKSGTAGCDPSIQLALTSVANKDAQTAAARFGVASRCAMQSQRNKMLLSAAYWWTQAGNASEATRWLNEARNGGVIEGKLKAIALDIERRIKQLSASPAP